MTDSRNGPDPGPAHESAIEADLHSLTDDEYFDALAAMPPVYDAEGREMLGLFDDVQDRRAEKRAAAERGEEWRP